MFGIIDQLSVYVGLITTISLIVLVLLTTSVIKFINYAKKIIKNKKYPILISIEGLIGVGKSTMINRLIPHLVNARFVPEPVEEWKKIIDPKDPDRNILGVFYDDMKRWSYSFQNIAYITRLISIIDTIKKPGCKYAILDRSLETDNNTFAKMLYDGGQIEDIEWQMYNKWCNFYKDNVYRGQKHCVIYLRCSPETALERNKKRARKEDKCVSPEYMKSLYKYHEAWLMKNPNINVLVLDCDQEFENNKKVFSDFLSKIKEFMKQIDEST